VNTLDIFRRAGRSLKQAKARTILTSLAIGVGAFTITISLAGGQGGRDYADAIVNSNTDVRELLVTKENEDADTIPEFEPNGAGSARAAAGGGGGGGFTRGLQFISLDDVEKMADINNVTAVTPSFSPAVDYITTEGQKKYQATVSPFSPSVSLTFAAGSTNGNLENNQIILAENFATTLGFTNPADAIGKTVQIGATKQRTVFSGAVAQEFSYEVAAVSSESGLAFRSQGSLLLNETAISQLYTFVSEGTSGYNRFLAASVIVAEPDQAEVVKATLEEQGFTAQTSADVLGTVNTFINVLLGVLLGFGALAVITSIFGIVNTQYISVLERTQQIGLMKALGMSQADVGKLFTFEAAWIGFLGGTIGAGLAVIGGIIANPAISRALDLGDISLLIFSPLQVLAVIVGLVLISIVAGILPARKASKLDPIEALRTE